MTDFFENLPIDIAQLPSAEENDYQQISPAYKKASLIAWGIFFFILLIGPPIIIFFIEEIKGEWLYYAASILTALVLWALNILWVSKAIKKKKYVLRQRDLIYTTGLLWQKKITIPFNRIQHAEVKQGPIERLYKLHNLNVFTAGGSSSDLSIPGLTEEKATKLKEFILNEIENEEDGKD